MCLLTLAKEIKDIFVSTTWKALNTLKETAAMLAGLRAFKTNLLVFIFQWQFCSFYFSTRIIDVKLNLYMKDAAQPVNHHLNASAVIA